MIRAVPESRMCKRGCCWNNFGTCGRTYTCRCHASKDSSAAARARLEDYLDSLGDE
ncbi:hypothetical protein [Arthrobacter sp. ISL-69]|uniref:hypothetical protein n=1 Tax=Arthrobacter sp. ISL-69 TaxID=2819113 RepID=UPI001BEBF447|nr:hypothetical protein [Arthrobacter sp. ISL-69]MBT2537225.1 hypothetical protein [Arthrobacter sp. ISL-69]